MRHTRRVNARLREGRCVQCVGRTDHEDWTFFLGQTRHRRQEQRHFAAARRIGHDLCDRAHRPAAPRQESVQHRKVRRDARACGFVSAQRHTRRSATLHVVAQQAVAFDELLVKHGVHNCKCIQYLAVWQA